MAQSNHDDPPNSVGETALAPGLTRRVPRENQRQLGNSSLINFYGKCWNDGSVRGPELDRIQFLKTVPFFNELSHRQLKAVSGICSNATLKRTN